MLFFILISVIIFFTTIHTFIHVKGLRGGYGKGVWCNSSTFMQDAIENRNTMILISILIILSWLMYLRSIF
ncbi:MAG: hypothetical protein ACD_33C00034G0002 [uncultured bacterium]|nr:MAG: hypothetical protein ACD_33C00034G0002 [uncultured bacterium]